MAWIGATVGVMAIVTGLQTGGIDVMRYGWTMRYEHKALAVKVEANTKSHDQFASANSFDKISMALAELDLRLNRKDLREIKMLKLNLKQQDREIPDFLINEEGAVRAKIKLMELRLGLRAN